MAETHAAFEPDVRTKVGSFLKRKSQIGKRIALTVNN
tara:strand:- start:10262 stop:10372 length:111 start_codon:yes stop_codon:yes gene_type:complete